MGCTACTEPQCLYKGAIYVSRYAIHVSRKWLSDIRGTLWLLLPLSPLVLSTHLTPYNYFLVIRCAGVQWVSLSCLELIVLRAQFLLQEGVARVILGVRKFKARRCITAKHLLLHCQPVTSSLIQHSWMHDRNPLLKRRKQIFKSLFYVAIRLRLSYLLNYLHVLIELTVFHCSPGWREGRRQLRM